MEREAQREEFERGLRRILGTLGPYLGDVVLIGGWVPELYRRYGDFDDWQGRSGLTREADVLLRSTVLNARQRQPVSELLERAGLEPVGDNVAGAPIWRTRNGADEVEFFVPRALVGRNPVAITGQPGLAAIALPRLDVLERHTHMLRLPASGQAPELQVRVPRLGAFVLNKAATFADRQPDAGSGSSPKRGKDLVYLCDLMSAGAAVVESIRADLNLMKGEADAVMLAKLGRTRLGALLRSPGHADWLAASTILAETGMDAVGARAELEGRLTDLHELLATMTSKRERKRKA